MDDLQKRCQQLVAEVKQATQQLNINDLASQLDKLRGAAAAADFWSDAKSAQETMKNISKLEGRVSPWLELDKQAQDLNELIKLNDESLATDLEQQLTVAENQLGELKAQLKFSGPFDDHAAIMSIYAGAGGTDAQDWTQMLFRMYVRWAESHHFSVATIDESAGEEAGLKSVTIEIDGNFVYGRLKSEHGVHRLVRLSPFNSDNLRQTSFAKVEILPKIDKPEDVAIDDKDLKIDVFRSGGHGGQSVNTTDSAVRITHLPTNITVVIQNERSQLQNKETALTILRSKLAHLQAEQHAENLAELKGPSQSAEWGNQIRSYVLHPYKQVKDLRTKHETSDIDRVLDGGIDEFIDAYLEQNLGKD